ncbi:ABC transporter permease [Candidatus Aerophobetes bacterium]|nr:ABC transporter permease [Candidatus Aerophobetes bacterium]
MQKDSRRKEGLFRKWEDIRRYWYKFSRNSLSIIGLVVVCIILFAAIFAPYISPYPKSAGKFINFYEASQPPNSAHLCGTDVFGRDVLTRVFFGYRFSLMMGIVVLALVVPVGVALGLIAGYYRGSWLDTIIMRITDIFVAVPPLILALAVCSVLTPGIFHAMMAVSLMWWPWYTRMVYGIASSLKGEFFVQAAEVGGASRGHILFKEILPNCIAPIFTKMSLDMGWVILIGASLSFVGLGVQPPTPDLGSMVADGSKYLPDQWWIAVFPAFAIMLVVLAFNLLGDGIRDMLGAKGG